MNYKINSSLFFLLKKGDIFLWDFKNHQQFKITEAYFNRIKEWSRMSLSPLTEIDQVLIDNHILIPETTESDPWCFDELSRIFHVGTCNSEKIGQGHENFIKDYLEHSAAAQITHQNLFVHREGKKTFLPTPEFSLLDSPLYSTLLKRKTVRNFTGEPVSDLQLSTFLFATFGLIHGPWKELTDYNLEEMGVRKSSPSGGGLHPVEAYVVVQNVKGIEAGIYHYDVERHFLTHVANPITDDILVDLLAGQIFAKGISFGIFMIAHLDKVALKYKHSRAYRVALLDAGHLSQTSLLCLTSMNIQTWLTGIFKDDALSQVLTLQSPTHVPLFFIAGGYGEGAVSKEMLEVLNKQ